MPPLDRLETRKDTLQVAIESGATHVGQIMGIVVGAVRVVMGMPKGMIIVRGHGRTSHAVAANLASPPLRFPG